MKKSVLLAAVLLLAAPAARAFQVRYPSKIKNVHPLILRLKAATGLRFEIECAQWVARPAPQVGYDCTQELPAQGRVMTGEGDEIMIEVYDTAPPTAERLTEKVTLTASTRAALRAKIEAALPEPAP